MNHINIFLFTVVPYILILSKFLFTNWCATELLWKNIKIYIKTTPTCFSAITIIRDRILWICKSYNYYYNHLKYIVVISSVMWLHILLGPYWCICGALFGMRLPFVLSISLSKGETLHCLPRLTDSQYGWKLLKLILIPLPDSSNSHVTNTFIEVSDKRNMYARQTDRKFPTGVVINYESLTLITEE